MLWSRLSNLRSRKFNRLIIDIDGMILQGNVIDIGIDIVDVLRIQDKVEKKSMIVLNFMNLLSCHILFSGI